MSDRPVIISAALCGAGTKKAQAPTVPYTPEEIAEQAIECAKAGAAIVHIHVREDKMVDDELQIGYKSMSLEKFTQTVELIRQKCKEEDVDVVINLTTSVASMRMRSAFSIWRPCIPRCAPSIPTP